MKTKILKDIKEAEKIGLKVQPGSFGSLSTMKCCPMTAVAMAHVGPNAISEKDCDRFKEQLVMPMVYVRLGVDEQWVLGFIRGYDSKSDARSKAANYKEGFDMGREIRREQ